MKMRDPQFAGQTKERLVVARARGVRLRRRQGPVRAVARISIRRAGDEIAQFAIENAQDRLKAGAAGRAQARSSRARRCRASSPTARTRSPRCAELFLVEGDSAGGSAKQARDREFQAIMPLRGKILNTWEVDPAELLASQEVHDIAVAIGVDPGLRRPRRPALPQDLHPRGRGLRRPAHRDAALRAVPAALPAAGAGGPRVRRDAAAVPRRRRQAGALRARRSRARSAARPDQRREADAARSRSRASRASAR